MAGQDIQFALKGRRVATQLSGLLVECQSLVVSWEAWGYGGDNPISTERLADHDVRPADLAAFMRVCRALHTLMAGESVKLDPADVVAVQRLRQVAEL